MKVLGMALLGMSIIMASCKGDQGEIGPTGPTGQGTKGDPGKDGIACWDLNGNGAEDEAEDINQDGMFDALDCAGNDGADGQDGSDKPNMEFYFQNGHNGYTGTRDAQISPDGTGDTNDGFMSITEDLDNANGMRRSLISFQGISDIVNSAFDTDGTSCSDSYIVNQAILYLYSDGSNVTAATPAYVHLGFYGTIAPLFDESEVSWTTANQVTNWLVAGGGASFTGPFGNNDSYTHYLPMLTTTSQNIGWIAVPLPQEVVQNWLCDSAGNDNKGIRLRLTSEANSGSTSIGFLTSESDMEDLRPLLVVQTTEVNPATTKMAPSSKAKDWDNMSYEEKMAPLYRYFAAKEAN